MGAQVLAWPSSNISPAPTEATCAFNQRPGRARPSSSNCPLKN
jgi:hypothetical protein